MAAMLAVGMGVLSFAGAAMSNRQEDKKALDEAKALGVRNAGITFGAERAGEHIVGQLSAIQDQKLQSYAEIQKAQARAESDATVAAAAAGVSGQSTEAVVNETERTAAEARKSVDDQIRGARLQLETDYTDNYLNAEISKGTKEFRSKNKSTRRMEGLLSFGEGFLSSGIYGD